MERDDVFKKLTEHVDACWPVETKERFTWQLGRISEVLPNFSVIRVAPASADQPWIYLTHGAWQVDVGSRSRSEFVLMAPAENPRHVETLAMLASFHANAKHHLSEGKSVAIGRGWLDGSEYDHLLVSPPYPFGPNLEFCKVDQELMVRFLWLLPINSSESLYLARMGVEALEDRLEALGVDYLDPHRPAVA